MDAAAAAAAAVVSNFFGHKSTSAVCMVLQNRHLYLCETESSARDTWDGDKCKRNAILKSVATSKEGIDSGKRTKTGGKK